MMSCIKLLSDSDVGGGGGGGGKLSLCVDPDLKPLVGDRACSGGGAGGGCEGLEGDPTALVGLSCSSEARGAALAEAGGDPTITLVDDDGGCCDCDEADV